MYNFSSNRISDKRRVTTTAEVCAAHCISKGILPGQTILNSEVMFAVAKRLISGGWSSKGVVPTLEEAEVPYSSNPCKDCPDPCEDDAHELYPSRFKIDQDRQLLGTVKPYHKQVFSPSINRTK
jgi:hypothetical protein